MSTSSIISLAPGEALSDRPFTNPHNTETDLTVLNGIRLHLQAIINSLPACVGNGQLYGQVLGCLHYRVVLLNRQILQSDQRMTVVGFCGQRRPHANLEALVGLDAELVGELQNHPYMLAYSSHEQPDGNWINLVVMDGAAQVQRWREQARHAYAARQVSPDYYASIRLHSGVLASGLGSPVMKITRTMYYDFQGGLWWQAMRAPGSQLDEPLIGG